MRPILPEKHVHDISGTAKGIKLKLQGSVKWET